MSTIPMAQTLVALVTSVEQAERPGLTITAATLDVPLEGEVVKAPSGPLFLAGPAHSRWRSGWLPTVSMAHLELARLPIVAGG
jgi:hypothetical protein